MRSCYEGYFIKGFNVASLGITIVKKMSIISNGFFQGPTSQMEVHFWPTHIYHCERLFCEKRILRTKKISEELFLFADSEPHIVPFRNGLYSYQKIKETSVWGSQWAVRETIIVCVQKRSRFPFGKVGAELGFQPLSSPAMITKTPRYRPAPLRSSLLPSADFPILCPLLHRKALMLFSSRTDGLMTEE